MFIIQKISIFIMAFLCAGVVIAQSEPLPSESYLEKLQRRYIPRLPYLMIPVIVVPIIKKGDLVGYLTIMAELKGAGVEEYRKLQVDSILIRDEIFCDLYTAMSRLWIGPEPPSVSTIEKRIIQRVNKFYKKNKVEKVVLHIVQLSLIASPKNSTSSL